MNYQLGVKLEKMNDKEESVGLFYQTYEVRLGEGEGMEIARERVLRKLEAYLERLTKAKI